MKNEISSPMLREIIKQLEDIYQETKSGKLKVTEAQAQITAIKHKIQAIALDWLYSRKMESINRLKERVLLSSDNN